MISRVLRCICVIAAVCVAPGLQAAEHGYTAFELQRDDNFAPLFTEDIDGDGRKDIIVPRYQRSIGRELHIHRQLADGSFASQPQRIEIKTDTIAVGFADLRDEPGMELVLFTASGVFSLSATREGYGGNLEPLLQWELIAGVAERERLRFVGSLPDINADGKADLLLPGAEEWGLFYGGSGGGDNSSGENFTEAARFTTLNPSLSPTQRREQSTEFETWLGINATEGLVIDVQAETPSPYAGFLKSATDDNKSDSSGGRNRSESVLLDSSRWLPKASFVTMDTEPGLDLVYINTGDDGLGRLHIHSQQADGGFNPAAHWSGAIDVRGDLRLKDFNADGLGDLLRLSGDGDEWVARFYLNQNGKFDLESPQQIMRFAGYDVRLEAVQLTDGQPPVLGVTYYTIPAVEALRDASVNRVWLIYGTSQARDGEIFNRRPDTRLEERFSAENVRGLAEPPSLRYDVDGDGRKDALYITDKGTLAARRIDPDLTLAEEPFWEYVSTRTVFGYEVLSMNPDARPDLLLRHGTVTTFLTAVQ